MQKEIKAVVFDLGQVLIQLDFSEVMAALGLPPQQSISEWLKNMDAWKNYDSFERGQVTEGDFFKPNPQLKSVWNSVLRDAIPDADGLLNALKKRVKIFALTNTNETHLRYAVSTYPFLAHFERVFSSHEIGARKPEPEIYQFVEKALGIEGTGLLFIDDREENVLGARALGWHAELCAKSPNDVTQILRSYQLLE